MIKLFSIFVFLQLMMMKISVLKEHTAAVLAAVSVDQELAISLLKEAKTSDQKEYGKSLQRTYDLVFICWMSKLQNKPLPWEPSPKQFLEPGWYSDLTWEKVKTLQKLWKLLEFGEPYIRNKCLTSGQSYPFPDVFHLFAHIVVKEVKNDFGVCLKDYHVVSRMKIIEHSDLAIDLLSQKKLKPQKMKWLEKYHSQHYSNPWQEFSFFTLWYIASEDQENRELKKRLDNYLEAIKEYYKVERAGWKRTRSSKRIAKMNSSNWEKGIEKTGDRYGGTYS